VGQTVVRSLVLVAIGSGGGFALNALRPGGLRPTAFQPPTQCDEAEGKPTEITPADAAGLCGQEGVVIADTRSAAQFAEGHVAGALHLPCDAAGQVASDAMSRLEGARTIVVYGASTAQARPVADSLKRRHHADVRVLDGGFSAWERAGLACASGPCGDCEKEKPHP
jgi:rhodanese-related sulfurtransferase